MQSAGQKPQIEYIAYGARENMIAEFAAFEGVAGRYLVKVIGTNDWDTDGFNSLKEAREHANYLAQEYSTKVVGV